MYEFIGGNGLTTQDCVLPDSRSFSSHGSDSSIVVKVYVGIRCMIQKGHAGFAQAPTKSSPLHGISISNSVSILRYKQER